MTLQSQFDDWDWREVYKNFRSKIERNKVCLICKMRFESAKAVKKHKRLVHAY
jgi:hypothetical protein